VKVMNVFGLQPKIRTDLADWAPDLFPTFTYLTNRKKNEYKDKAYKMVDKLFDQTEHSSYFSKLNFGCKKKKLKTLNNSSLYLLILTWLRQLEEYYFSFESNGDFRSDWNKYGKYFGTPSMLKAAPLANIHMTQASEHRIPVTHVTYFVPDNRKGVCASLEEWGAKFFEPDILQILHDAKKADKQTKIQFERSKKLKGRFSFTGEDLSKNVKEGDNKKNGGGASAGVGTS
jgi:hypothetical protein